MSRPSSSRLVGTLHLGRMTPFGHSGEVFLAQVDVWNRADRAIKEVAGVVAAIAVVDGLDVETADDGRRDEAATEAISQSFAAGPPPVEPAFLGHCFGYLEAQDAEVV